MLRAQSAFNNEGKMLQPWFVDSVSNPVTDDTFYKGKKSLQENQLRKTLLRKCVLN